MVERFLINDKSMFFTDDHTQKFVVQLVEHPTGKSVFFQKKLQPC